MHNATYFTFTYFFLGILELLNISWTLTKTCNTHKGCSCQKKKNRLIRILALSFDGKDCSPPLRLLRGSWSLHTGSQVQEVRDLSWIPHLSSVCSSRPKNNINKIINFKRQLLLYKLRNIYSIVTHDSYPRRAYDLHSSDHVERWRA